MDLTTLSHITWMVKFQSLTDTHIGRTDAVAESHQACYLTIPYREKTDINLIIGGLGTHEPPTLTLTP